MLLNAYCTLREPPPMDFPHTLGGHRERSPELTHHLRGFMAFVMKDNRPMTQTRFHVLQHLRRVRHHFSVEVEDTHMDAFARWAAMANAIVFATDATVRTPDGRILVAPDTGEGAKGADVPHPVDAVRRKARTAEALRDLGLTATAGLPPVVSELEVDLRTPKEVALRCLALFACAVRAESLAENDPIPVEKLRAQMPLGFGALSPDERAFLEKAAPDKQELANHGWAQEALGVLAWSVGWVPELPFPTQIVDVPALAKIVLTHTTDAAVSAATLRSPSEILDALDLHYRLHWITTDARVKNTPCPGSLVPGVVLERHRALNWLTKDQDADWDDVDTAT